jgi:ribosomal-protein-alanine N-acetyltransferase
MAEVAAAIHAASGFDEPWSPASFAGLLATPGVAGRLALADGEPAGLALWRVAADEAEILTVCTLPDRRRAGFGRALMEAATAASTTAGARRLYLEVAVDNVAAIALYQRLGFVRAGLRKGYYRRTDGAVDATILARDI